MKRSSSTPQRLTSLFALSRPAANTTISSVPPAIGIHCPGAEAIRSSPAGGEPGATSSCSAALPRMHLLLSGLGAACGCGQNGFEDANESRAATEIASESFADFSHGWLGIMREQMFGRHQHARRANAA